MVVSESTLVIPLGQPFCSRKPSQMKSGSELPFDLSATTQSTDDEYPSRVNPPLQHVIGSASKTVEAENMSLAHLGTQRTQGGRAWTFGKVIE